MPFFSKLTSRKLIGNKAENQASEYLQKEGLILIEENFSIPAGEIDLIMKDPDDSELLIFIEVRYRKNSTFGGAAASVTVKKQQRIIKAALTYHQKHAPQSSLRFDVVAIEGDNMEINWIKSAFDGY